MPDAYTLERIENWASDFCHNDRMIAFGAETAAVAPQVLTMLLAEAVDAGSGKLDEISEANLKSALLGSIAKLALPEDARREVPGLCAGFLGWLETEGRLGGGKVLGAFVAALRSAFESEKPGTKARQYVRPAKPVGPNDPCPCGSGLKYKKCCLRR